ncbi:MAG: AbiH family protein [Ruminococcus sp.]|jgi:hypothetical protein
MHREYMAEGNIKGVKAQNNIMVFIGNGFDISVLKKYRSDNLISSYSKFYDYLVYKEFNKNNILYKKMGEDKDQGKENWSDFECTLGKLIHAAVPQEELQDALSEIQNMFLLFLNEIVTPEILIKLSDDAAARQWSITSLSRFLGDLTREDFEKMEFPGKTDHYHMMNYLFINFNYTSLFDDYIYLDKVQHDRQPNRTIDTNFTFIPNPNKYAYSKNRKDGEEIKWSSFIMTDIIHPHGYQNIPRSLLFGVESVEYKNDKSRRRFNKSYWAQDDQKYKTYFANTDLYIIYGASMGETDSWWWRNIYESLKNRKSELLIYYYNPENLTAEKIKQIFIDGCNLSEESEKVKKQVKEKIYVVSYDDSRAVTLFHLD